MSSERDGYPYTADRGRSFGAVADVYATTRPDYPAAAVRWVAGPDTADVLDLGAGTGKLTQALVTAGFTVTAVEPLPEMLDRLRRELPEVLGLAGSAEQIPLAAASVDAVYVGQAFHWFRPDEALAEIGRVLRPGGRLGLLWNMLDTRVAWVAALSAVLHENSVDYDPAGVRPFDSPLFADLEYRQHDHPGHPIDLPGLLDLVRSRSYIVTMPPDERSAVLDRVARLAGNHPDLRGRESFSVPYVTDAWRAVLTA